MEKELPKALEAIRKLDPTLSTLSSALNIKNVPERKTHFGKQLAKLCGEDAGTMSEWISMMETSAMCGNVGVDVSEAIGKHIQKQCGQWCMFDIERPDDAGWVFNGQCFTKFEDRQHECHKFISLKDKLKF